MTKTKATAVAIVELEITIDSHWGEDSTVGQIEKQSSDAAKNLIIKICADFAPGRIRLLKTPEIKIITFKDK